MGGGQARLIISPRQNLLPPVTEMKKTDDPSQIYLKKNIGPSKSIFIFNSNNMVCIVEQSLKLVRCIGMCPLFVQLSSLPPPLIFLLFSHRRANMETMVKTNQNQLYNFLAKLDLDATVKTMSSQYHDFSAITCVFFMYALF